MAIFDTLPPLLQMEFKMQLEFPHNFAKTVSAGPICGVLVESVDTVSKYDYITILENRIGANANFTSLDCSADDNYHVTINGA